MHLLGRVFWAIIWTAFLTGIVLADNPKTAEDFHNRAKEHFRRGFDQKEYFATGTMNYDRNSLVKAIKDCDEALRLHSSNHPYRWFLTSLRSSATILIEMADLTKTIQSEPKNISAYIDRGNNFLNLNYVGMDKKALADFSEAIRMDPKNSRALTGRGHAYTKLRNYDKAIADLSDAIRLSPNKAEAFYRRGVVNAKTVDYKPLAKAKAIADLSEAIRLSPNNAEAFYQRAELYTPGDDKHIANLSEAIRLNPKLYGGRILYHNRGWSYVVKGKHALAVADFQEALRIDPRRTGSNDTTAKLLQASITTLRKSGKQPEVLSVTLDNELKLVVVKKSPAYKLAANSEKVVEDTIRVKHELTVTEGWKAEAKVRGTVKAWFAEVQVGVRAGIEKSTNQKYGVETERKRSVTIKGTGSAQGVRVVWVDLYRTGRAVVKLDGVTFEMPFSFREDYDLITEDAMENDKR